MYKCYVRHELDNSTRSGEEKRPVIVYILPQEEKIAGQIVSSCPKMSSDDSPSSKPSSDLEMELELESEPTEANQQSAESFGLIHPLQQQMDWSVLVLGFCLTSATEIAMQSLQAKTQLPLSVHLVSMGMVLAFACIFMAKFVPSRFPNHAKGLEYAGIFCAATAFFLAITVAVPLCLKLISWSIYVLILLAIFKFHVLPHLWCIDLLPYAMHGIV